MYIFTLEWTQTHPESVGWSEAPRPPLAVCKQEDALQVQNSFKQPTQYWTTAEPWGRQGEGGFKENTCCVAMASPMPHAESELST